MITCYVVGTSFKDSHVATLKGLTKISIHDGPKLDWTSSIKELLDDDCVVFEHFRPSTNKKMIERLSLYIGASAKLKKIPPNPYAFVVLKNLGYTPSYPIHGPVVLVIKANIDKTDESLTQSDIETIIQCSQ